MKQEPVEEVPATPEAIDVDVDASWGEDITVTGAFNPPAAAKYKTYQAASDIDYDPEVAIQEGIEMINTLEESLGKMSIGNKLREQVWHRELRA